MASVAIKGEADCLRSLGELNKSAALYEEATRRDKERGDKRDVAAGICQLATVRMLQGRYKEAESAYIEARKIFEDLPSPRRQYAVFVSTMDAMIGEFLDHLEASGQADHTIVVFQSDHGHSTEERAFGGGGNCCDYRGAKGCLFEGGIRVPSIVRWPGRVPAGAVRDQMVFGCDWFPTLAQWAGGEPPADAKPLDGKSIAGVIERDEASPHDHLYWQLGRGRGAQWVVRKGSWKLLGNPKDNSKKAPIAKDDRPFLANLEQDPSEMKNLAAANPEIVRELKALQLKHAASLAKP